MEDKKLNWFALVVVFALGLKERAVRDESYPTDMPKSSSQWGEKAEQMIEQSTFDCMSSLAHIWLH